MFISLFLWKTSGWSSGTCACWSMCTGIILSMICQGWIWRSSNEFNIEVALENHLQVLSIKTGLCLSAFFCLIARWGEPAVVVWTCLWIWDHREYGLGKNLVETCYVELIGHVSKLGSKLTRWSLKCIQPKVTLWFQSSKRPWVKTVTKMRK